MRLFTVVGVGLSPVQGYLKRHFSVQVSEVSTCSKDISKHVIVYLISVWQALFIDLQGGLVGSILKARWLSDRLFM